MVGTKRRAGVSRGFRLTYFRVVACMNATEARFVGTVRYTGRKGCSRTTRLVGRKSRTFSLKRGTRTSLLAVSTGKRVSGKCVLLVRTRSRLVDTRDFHVLTSRFVTLCGEVSRGWSSEYG